MSNQLHEQVMQKYCALLETSPDEVYKKFGFFLYYSTPDEYYFKEKKRLFNWNPKKPRDYYNFGCIENEKGNHKKAIEYYEKALEKGGNFPCLYFNLALSYEQLEEKSKSLKYFKEYLKIVDETELCKEEKLELEEIKKKLAEG